MAEVCIKKSEATMAADGVVDAATAPPAAAAIREVVVVEEADRTRALAGRAVNVFLWTVAAGDDDGAAVVGIFDLAVAVAGPVGFVRERFEALM
jgi:hypothetical protein